MVVVVAAIGARAVGEGSPMERWAVGIEVRLGWDEGTDRAHEPLYRGPVDPGSLLRSLPLIVAHSGWASGMLVDVCRYF